MIVSKYNQNNDSSISNNYKALYNYANNLNQNEFAHMSFVSLMISHNI